MPVSAIARPQRINPSTRLVSGPTTAIVNSVRGFSGSSSRLLTPPKMKRVILPTFMPRAWATREWANSCSSTEIKRERAVTTPMTQ